MMVEPIERWCALLARQHHEKLDIAVRSTISALTFRQDRGDALIDAVIAWENLFGTSSETSFRVTAALAWLLESDPAQRKGLQQQLKNKIYNKRSRLVHGAHLNATELDKAATDAIDVGLKSLAALHARAPSLIALDSATRADKLILGEPL